MTKNVSQAEILANCLRSFIGKGKEVARMELSRDLFSSGFNCCAKQSLSIKRPKTFNKTELMPHKAQNRVTCASMAPPRCGDLDRSARLKRNSERDLLGVACVCVQTAVGLDGVHF